MKFLKALTVRLGGGNEPSSGYVPKPAPWPPAPEGIEPPAIPTWKAFPVYIEDIGLCMLQVPYGTDLQKVKDVIRLLPVQGAVFHL